MAIGGLCTSGPAGADPAGRKCCGTEDGTLLTNEPLQITMINTAEDDDTVFELLSSFAPDTDSLMDRDDQATEA